MSASEIQGSLQCQTQRQQTTCECNYDTALMSVGFDWKMFGHTLFPREYKIGGNESFIVSLEERTDKLIKVQFLKRCHPNEEGAKSIPSDTIMLTRGERNQHPIFYKRCEDTLKSAERKYSVTFDPQSKISQKNQDSIKLFLQKISADNIDIEDFRLHPWNKNEQLGVVNPSDDSEIFVHDVFDDFCYSTSPSPDL